MNNSFGEHILVERTLSLNNKVTDWLIDWLIDKIIRGKYWVTGIKFVEFFFWQLIVECDENVVVNGVPDYLDGDRNSSFSFDSTEVCLC